MAGISGLNRRPRINITTPAAVDIDIRTCARVVFDHFGDAAILYAAVKLAEAEAEGNREAVAVWMRIAAVIGDFDGMHASTSIH
jgi:hypothetical protein